MSIRKLLFFAFVSSLLVSAAIGIFILLFGNMGALQTKILLSTLTISAACILAIAPGARLDRHSNDPIAWAGIVLTIISTLWLVMVIWELNPEELSGRLLVSCWILASAISLECGLSLARLADRHRWIQTSAYLVTALLALLILFAIWAQDGGDWLIRIIGAASIAQVTLTIMVPIMHKLNSGAKAKPEAFTQLCPECETRVVALAKPVTCKACGTRFQVQNL